MKEWVNMKDYYEILQVHPKASQEIIKKAYQTLAKKYHPDIHPDKDKADKMMASLNEAYSVLSDSVKRQAYDNSIHKTDPPNNQGAPGQSASGHPSNNNRTQEQQKYSPEMQQIIVARIFAHNNGEEIINNTPSSYRWNGCGTTLFEKDYNVATQTYVVEHWFTIFFIPILPFSTYRILRKGNKYLVISRIPFKGSYLKKFIYMHKHNVRSYIGLAIIIALMIGFSVDNSAHSKTATPPSSSSKTAVPATHNTKTTVKAVPKSGVKTEYTSDNPMLNNDGLCKLTIDNSQNDMPVYVKIWDKNINSPVRSFTINALGKFTAEKLTPGDYEVRYKELYENDVPTFGQKTQLINLKQIDQNGNIKYSNTTITLYKVKNGTLKTSQIPIDDI